MQVEVFADVWCPFTHVGLRRFVELRERMDVPPVLVVRSWPLELVNGAPMAPAFIAEEVDDIRGSVAPTCSPASTPPGSRPRRCRPWRSPAGPTSSRR